MEQDITGLVLSAQGRLTKNQKTIYDIAFSDGNTYTTFDGQLAEKANSLIGEQVSARVKVEQKGQYTNRYLNDIAPQGQLTPAAFPAAGGTVVPIAAAPAPSIPITQSSGGMSPERESKIIKQNVLGTAHAFVASLFQGAGPEAFEEAQALAQQYAQVLFGIVVGTQTPSGGAVSASNGLGGASPAPTSPEAVAAAVNETAGQEVVAPGATIQW